MQHPRDIARKSTPSLRTPTAEDGPAIWELVRSCKPLDENSIYCNLLQCDHFADTCVVAELDGEVVGWISGYLTPNAGDTLFVWQVAVSEKARGMGLGVTMLQSLLNREICAGVTRLQTTITADNAASWGMFRKFARVQGGTLSSEPHFLKSEHFKGRASTENMVTIDLDSDAMERAA
ncbi:diaminobutyrate acetyltransferase [Sagittula salina]|uniref:L-2,4-diaminobutyric acid acetyltransferase n=1 Tax=Sagittula salina TaxID=2820268 RepID=A0A940MQS3_9RHOB|nr:diaminobutyrate acetyltransferase [Sagittula salina]MBP0483076.1 diaminobutyrate acetyltransferase [Sagittula salina]